MKILPRSALLALLALIAAPAAAQEAQPPRPALWKVADADTTIYLFGTIHALPEGVEWLNGDLEKAVESSDELVTELPEIDSAAAMDFVLRNGLQPAGKTLRQQMSADDRARLEGRLAALGAPANALDKFEAWFAFISLLQTELGRIGVSAVDGVENALAARMVTRNKRPRVGLETLEFQLGLFDSLPLATQNALLLDMADSGPTLREDFARMVDEWAKGEPETLAGLLNKDETSVGLLEVLLTQRNRNWAQWIKARLDKPGTTFMAVGAGHLAGPGSVQEQLIGLGIKSERVQ